MYLKMSVFYSHTRVIVGLAVKVSVSYFPSCLRALCSMVSVFYCFIAVEVHCDLDGKFFVTLVFFLYP